MRKRNVVLFAAAAVMVLSAVGAAMFGNRVIAAMKDFAYSYTPVTMADPADGPALTHEAIKNVRGMKKFRFTQTLSAGGAGPALTGGASTGEVDLSSSGATPPKLRTKTNVHTLTGDATPVETVTVGDEVRTKAPKATEFKASNRAPVKIKGKSAGAGGGTEDVDVIDPVMQILEPIDKLPDASFGTPSAPDADGVRSVDVTANGVVVTLLIDDTQHLVRGMHYSGGGRTADYVLKDFGDSAIDIGF